MKIYLSGPITGVENYMEIFNRHEAALKETGHEVINPAKLNHDHDKSWTSYMKEDIRALLDCDVIALIPGWEESRGARIECGIAKRLGMDLLFLKED
jgi:nucleoside 2-deoxyribosyltransferase